MQCKDSANEWIKFVLFSTSAAYLSFYDAKIDDDQIDESLLERYNRLIAQLQLVEMPEETVERLDELAEKIRKNPNVRFLSRKSINKFLKDNPGFLSDWFS